jgi:ketosteroid isomerase-like protein
MANHPNFDLTESALEAVRNDDYGPAFDGFTDDVIVENGPGAGPWHRAQGKDDLAVLYLEFADALNGTFHQDGHCVYADDRVAIARIHETGKSPSGDAFDNMAIYVYRFGPDGKVNRLWTTDLDAEHCEEFWSKTPGTPSKDFS